MIAVPPPRRSDDRPVGRPVDRIFDGLARRAGALRPRLVTFRLERRGARRPLHLRWAVPLWAFEESLRFALRVAALAGVVAPRALPRLAPHLSPRWRSRAVALASALPTGDWRAVFDDRSSGAADLLALPPGEPYLSIETDELRFEIVCW